MLNKYPFWKNILIIIVIAWGLIYSLPNMYPSNPAITIINNDNSQAPVSDHIYEQTKNLLTRNNIDFFTIHKDKKKKTLRFKDFNNQSNAKDIINEKLDKDYRASLNIEESTPQWLLNIGAKAMKKGLDLSGGIHFLLQADLGSAFKKRINSQLKEIKSLLRAEKDLYYSDVRINNNSIVLEFKNLQYRNKAYTILQKNINDLIIKKHQQKQKFQVILNYAEQSLLKFNQAMMKKNLEVINKRVNELGVSEALVQAQGTNHIVVELPGIQDLELARTIIGKMAELEFRLEAKTGSGPSTKEHFSHKNNTALKSYLEKTIITTGKHVQDANASYDEYGKPQVQVYLDFHGGKRMTQYTSPNIGRNMGVLFIESKSKITYEKNKNGQTKTKIRSQDEKHIISLARINTPLPSSFVISGLRSITEANEIALLLRSGSLATPMVIVQQGIIGPSLGQDNIDKGVQSVKIGFTMIFLFMLYYYRLFGLFANLALLMNLLLVTAIMSVISATLTLPGIAGIVLIVGMAVDANVLVFARIREELVQGSATQAAIHKGFTL